MNLITTPMILCVNKRALYSSPSRRACIFVDDQGHAVRV